MSVESTLPGGLKKSVFGSQWKTEHDENLDLLDGHLEDTANPHGVTKSNVGLGDVENLKVNLAANAAPGVNDDGGSGYAVGSRWIDTTNDKEYVCLDASSGTAVWTETTGAGAGGGEANTGSNVGTAGVGVFKQKSGVDLQFKNINAGSSKITVTDDAGNDEIDIDVAEVNIDHGSIGGLTDDDHTQYHNDTRHDARNLNTHADVTSAGADIDDAVTKKHSHSNKSELDLVTDGDHDVRNDNPHSVTAAQAGASPTGHGHVAADVSDFDTEVGNHTEVAANTTHRGQTDNPHVVTKSQVGLGNAENLKVKLDATDVPGVNDDSGSGYAVGSRWIDTTNDKEYVCLDASSGAAVWTETTGAGGGGGEANTGSNVGTAGVGVFKQKSGVDLQFKNINAGSSKITVTDDAGNDEIDIDVNEANIDHANIANTHNLTTDIDHNQIANYDSAEHREINDAGTAATDLWSGQKIGNDLSGKAASGHNHSGTYEPANANIQSHISSTSNPHSVTKAQVLTGNLIANADIDAAAAIALSKLATDPLARANHTGTQAASTISDFDTQVRTSRLDQMAAPTADVSMNSKRITDLASPTAGADAVRKDYVDSKIQGLDWQDSVLDRYDPTSGLPGTPSTGDRYIATATANGWAVNRIYEYNGASWDESIPNEGAALRVEDEDTQYVYNGASWVTFGSTVNHDNLINAGTNAHTQIDSHIVDGTLHFTEGSIDHGSIGGLSDDDHTQYHTDARHDARNVNTHADVTSAGADIDDAVTKKHSHANSAQLDLVTDGDHDVRNDNPHSVTAAQAGASPTGHGHTASDVSDFDTEVGNHTDVAANTTHTGADGSDHADVATNTTHRGLTNNPHSVTKAQVSLTNVEDLKVKLDATVAPDADNDTTEGYSVGSRWFDVTADKEYVCLDATDTAAVWTETTGASGGGDLVQRVNTQTGAVNTGTTQIPLDDSIPVKTEGDEYMTLAITPTSATNILYIDVVAAVAHGGTDSIVAALFQDDTTNALAAIATNSVTSNVGQIITFRHKMTAGTTSATTFKLRMGGNIGGTTRFNSDASGRLLGDVMASSITITEVKA